MSLGDKEAIHGKKMIEVKIRFWTNDISTKKGKVIPKHCWDSGVIRVQPNDLHSIKVSKPMPFHTLLDLPSTIEKILLAHNIKLHLSRKTRKYYCKTDH